MKKLFLVLMIVAATAFAITGCEKNSVIDFELEPEPNKEQIKTQQEDDRDSIPPGHHPENDDDDPYGGKYDPIWFH